MDKTRTDKTVKGESWGKPERKTKSHRRAVGQNRSAFTLIRASLVFVIPRFANRTRFRLEGSVILANEVVLLHARIAGVSGRQIGSLERHLTGALRRRQVGRGTGRDGLARHRA